MGSANRVGTGGIQVKLPFTQQETPGVPSRGERPARRTHRSGGAPVRHDARELGLPVVEAQHIGVVMAPSADALTRRAQLFRQSFGVDSSRAVRHADLDLDHVDLTFGYCSQRCKAIIRQVAQDCLRPLKGISAATYYAMLLHRPSQGITFTDDFRFRVIVELDRLLEKTTRPEFKMRIERAMAFFTEDIKLRTAEYKAAFGVLAGDSSTVRPGRMLKAEEILGQLSFESSHAEENADQGGYPVKQSLAAYKFTALERDALFAELNARVNRGMVEPHFVGETIAKRLDAIRAYVPA